MMLDSFELHPGVLWVNEITAPAVAQQITKTILSNIHVYHNPLPRREMLLEARNSGSRVRGYFTREQTMHLRAAEESGTTVVIQYRSVSYNTIVKAGGVQLTPKKEIEAVEDDDVYTGTVTLQEI